ncbi:MAG: energy transducer TonB [Bryobacteraceae bacterium]
MASLCSLGPAQEASNPGAARVSESSFRHAATNIVVPVYPLEAVRSGVHGVAVADVQIDETGAVSRVQVLEAPSPSIGRAMISALSKWRLPPTTISGRPTVLLGKVTYYFFIEKGRPKVASPAEAPYLGRW